MHRQDYTKAKIGETIFRFATPGDDIISTIIGDNQIGLDESREFVELHFYGKGNNTLVKSVNIPLSEGHLYIRDSYGVYKENQVIELGLELWNPEQPETSLYTKYLSDMSPGIYNVLVNFFSTELGNQNLYKIATISETRRELILESISEFSQSDRTEFEQFVNRSIAATDFKRVMYYLFDKNITDRKGGSRSYGRIINKFFDVLKTMDSAAFSRIQEEELILSVKTVLRDIIDNVYGDFMGGGTTLPDGSNVDNWIDEEINANRFRITDKNFEQALQRSIHANVRDGVSEFPSNTQARGHDATHVDVDPERGHRGVRIPPPVFLAR